MQTTCRFVLLKGTVMFAMVSVLGVSQMLGQSYQYTKQGYSMRLCLDNRGTFGRTPYPGVIGGTDPGGDSIGLSYPIGQPYEHIFGAGLWVGGILDTAQIGTSTPVKLVTTGYEGWTGPYFEFWPGSTPADTIWEVLGRGIPRPSSWETYWDNLIPAVSFSDNDRYCLYDDFHVRVTGDIPLRLLVAQSSFVWSNPYAEEIQIMRYRIVNMGVKEIDSAFIGMFMDADVGPYRVSNFAQRNYAGYYADVRTAYIHNPVDIGSTPVGITLLDASRPLDSLRCAFRWWYGSTHPGTDQLKYQLLASGQVDSNQSLSSLSDARCLVSFGPFTIRPSAGSNPDTVTVAFGIVSGQSLTAMRLHAERASIIYFNGGLASVDPTGNELPSQFELFQNYPNPFNPTTTIRFTIPPGACGRTSLRVFDLLGRLVATLVDGIEEPGSRSVRFDASALSSGIYFYRLENGTFVKTRKLVVLR